MGAWPDTLAEEQAGGWHLHAGDADAAGVLRGIEEDYCRQIVNEARTRKPGGGYVWVKRGKAHDYLDCEAMAFGAAKMLESTAFRMRPRRQREPRRARIVKPAGQPAPREAAATLVGDLNHGRNHDRNR